MTTDDQVELPETSVVRRSPVVLVVATEFGVEGFLLLFHSHVPVSPALLGHRLRTPAEPFACRSHVDCELPSPIAFANMRLSRNFTTGLSQEPSVRLSPHSAPIRQTCRPYGLVCRTHRGPPSTVLWASKLILASQTEILDLVMTKQNGPWLITVYHGKLRSISKPRRACCPKPS
jgi:hypothetical protein